MFRLNKLNTINSVNAAKLKMKSKLVPPEILALSKISYIQKDKYHVFSPET